MVITKPHSITQSQNLILGAVFELFKQMVKRWEKEERNFVIKLTLSKLKMVKAGDKFKAHLRTFSKTLNWVIL